MMLKTIQGLPDLYPPIRTRSGKLIPTTELAFEPTDDGLVVIIKTIFPPARRRRSQLVVTERGGEIHVAPRTPEAMEDAHTFATAVRARLGGQNASRTMKPLRTEKRGSLCYLVVAPAGGAKVSAEPTKGAS